MTSVPARLRPAVVRRSGASLSVAGAAAAVALTAALQATEPSATPQPTPAPTPAPRRLFAQDVAWAPDGSRFAFSRYSAAGDYDGRHWAVWVAERDGARPRRVLEGALVASFSPDGSRLAVGALLDGDWEIATVRVDGGDLRRLTRRPGRDSAPAWSPDGSTIAFSAKAGDEQHLWAIDATGERLRQLTRGPGSDYNPAFSPDGSRLVFYRAKGDAMDQVWLLDLASGRETRVTDGAGHHVFPSFLPDGRIAFASKLQSEGPVRLAIHGAAPAGGEPLGPEGIFYARWSPDGREVLFLTQGGSQVRSMPASGGEPRVVVDLVALEDR
jgi:TolB protein